MVVGREIGGRRRMVSCGDEGGRMKGRVDIIAESPPSGPRTAGRGTAAAPSQPPGPGMGPRPRG